MAPSTSTIRRLPPSEGPSPELTPPVLRSQTLNEIMPMIYRRFTEKSAQEWRQIYKALQLLEFLIKHGSERVIDDARSHLTLLKMLRQFHFIDQNGKDQGINVRNRAKELAELLSDVDRIRSDRKKARANRAKYTGVEGGSTLGGGLSGSSGRYGGFGSESGGYGGSSANFGGYSGGVYGDGGGFGGQSEDWRDSGSRPEQFEEYDEFDEAERPAASSVKRNTAERAGTKKTTEPAKKKEPEVDLFSFDEPVQPSSSAAVPAHSNDDDEFDDFQFATPSTQAAPQTGGIASPLAPPPMTTANASSAQFAAPKPVSAPQQANLGNMVGLSSISPASSTTNTPAANYSGLQHSDGLRQHDHPHHGAETDQLPGRAGQLLPVRPGGSATADAHRRHGDGHGDGHGGRHGRRRSQARHRCCCEASRRRRLRRPVEPGQRRREEDEHRLRPRHGPARQGEEQRGDLGRAGVHLCHTRAAGGEADGRQLGLGRPAWLGTLTRKLYDDDFSVMAPATMKAGIEHNGRMVERREVRKGNDDVLRLIAAISTRT